MGWTARRPAGGGGDRPVRRSLGSMARSGTVRHRIAVSLAASLWLAVSAGTAAAQPVDLELILAIDCSYSVDDAEFALQRSGMAEAFMTETVISAIEAGKFGAIAVTVVQWSSLTSQAMSVPWTVVHDTASAQDFAARIAGMERTSEEGGTSISAMINVGIILFDVNRFEGTRKVIDISADGPNNNGPKIAPVRALANDKGVTVNGLTILHEDKTLDYYFRNRVITGDDAFVVKAAGYENYVEAILQKLVREIGNPATS